MSDFTRLFMPTKIVVIGATNSLDKLGGIVMNNLIKGGFSGRIYPINPKFTQIFGITAYKSLADLPDSPDLAIIALNAQLAVAALEDMGKHQIPYAIIFAGGFSEIQEYNLEEKVKHICTTSNIRLIGPNCMGVWSKHGMNASFMNILPKYPGQTTFLSQSGSLIAFSIYLKLRLGKFVSLGNSANVSFHDLLPTLAKDPDTKVLALYIESLQNARAFLAAVKNYPKPIVVVKAGDTESGQRSIASHTGALAGNAQLYDALFRAYGLFRVKSFESLVSVCRTLELLPLLKNNKVVALSNAGGAVCLFSDACSEQGIDISPLPPDLKKQLEQVFPAQAPINNPLDLTVTGATAETVKKVFEILFNTSMHDYGAIVYIPVVAPYVDPIQEAQLAIQIYKDSPLPFLICLLAGEKVAPAIPLLDQAEVAYCDTIQQTAEALSFLWRWSQRVAKKVN